MDMVKKEGLDDVLVVVGGVIPKKDVSMLKYLRVKRIFPGGATFDEITNFIRENAKH
jgi:methylmalonyl-CoA mutase C-terminal domain/subunit